MRLTRRRKKSFRFVASSVLGGCCGTDHRHVREGCEAWPTRSSDCAGEENDMGEHVHANDLNIWTEQVGEGPDVLLIGGAGDTVESW